MAARANFMVGVSMEERWVPHFLGLLREMQTLGNIGSSRTLSFYSDGDGDFRPRFEWDINIEPVGSGDDLTWDAG